MHCSNQIEHIYFFEHLPFPYDKTADCFPPVLGNVWCTLLSHSQSLRGSTPELLSVHWQIVFNAYCLCLPKFDHHHSVLNFYEINFYIQIWVKSCYFHVDYISHGMIILNSIHFFPEKYRTSLSLTLWSILSSYTQTLINSLFAFLGHYKYWSDFESPFSTRTQFPFATCFRVDRLDHVEIHSVFH